MCAYKIVKYLFFEKPESELNVERVNHAAPAV